MTTTTSAEKAAESIPERTATCSSCPTVVTQYRIAGRWGPVACDDCRAVPPQETAPAPELTDRYKGSILDDLRNAGVNVWKYGDATLDAVRNLDDPHSVAQHDGHALEPVDRWLRECWAFPRRLQYPPRDWMYLYGAGSDRNNRDVKIGKLGNGKTFLAIALARHLIENRMLEPKRFRFATAESILLEAEATFRANADDSEKNMLRRYERPDLLIIDEFGARDMSPHAVRLFDELTKLREAKATIWTSNLSVRVISGGPEYMKRIADRIAGECGDGAAYMLEFSGPSRRIARSRRTA